MCTEVVYALRLMLDEVGVEKAFLYRPHDLRRGHAEDLRLSGGESIIVGVAVVACLCARCPLMANTRCGRMEITRIYVVPGRTQDGGGAGASRMLGRRVGLLRGAIATKFAQHEFVAAVVGSAMGIKTPSCHKFKRVALGVLDIVQHLCSSGWETDVVQHPLH